MKTTELVRILATDAPAARPARPAPRLLAALAAGAAVSAGILALWLGLRPMGPALASASFWMKAGYAAALAGAGALATARLARPGGRVGWALWMAVAAVALLAVMAGRESIAAARGTMLRLWLGDTWDVCPLRILALSLPVLAAVFWMLRGMAPTRPALAGGAAGAAAGAVGAAVYGLYCQETTAAFVVVWYSLGIGAAVALGAILGRRLLRW
jgi:hypothetical protein